MTPDELRAEADRLDALADDVERVARVEAAALRFQAAEFRDAAAKGLTILADRAIVRYGMQAATAPGSARQYGRPSKVKHPFRDHLKRVGSDVETWARTNKLSPSTVKAWMRKPADGGRKIPGDRAAQIEREAGLNEQGKPHVPATAATWPAGIKA